jgi:D-lactate dehydrogenase
MNKPPIGTNDAQSCKRIEYSIRPSDSKIIMKIAVFSTKGYDRQFLGAVNAGRHELTWLEPRLTAETAMLAEAHDAVCVFVHDRVDRGVLQTLHEGGCRFVALRCAGFNNVDLDAAREFGIGVARVPAYSPYAVAEHAAGLILTLNRKYHRAYNRVREGNFSLEGLLGFDLHGRTVGVIGTGKIGMCFIRIMLGFGCRVLAYDPFPSDELSSLGVESVTLEEVLAQADIISLHCPLTPETHHLINAQTLAQMQQGTMLINTESWRAGRRVRRHRSDEIRKNSLRWHSMFMRKKKAFSTKTILARSSATRTLMLLLSFPNVVVTGHQAFFTREALDNIAQTTIGNVSEWEENGSCKNAVRK